MSPKLKPKEVATILDVSYNTVMKYIKEGSLKAEKEGGSWIVKNSDLRKFMEERRMKEELKQW